MSRTSRRSAVIGLVAGFLLLFGLPLHALGPTVVMFYGGPLAKPVVVTGADINALGSFTDRASMTAESLGTRPRVNVALFWGPIGNPAMNGTPIDKLTPQMAWQHGLYFPPQGSKPAVLLTTLLAKQSSPVPVPTNLAAYAAGGPLPESAIPVLRKLGLLFGDAPAR